jgi:serine phosphatase RsbU (regulator of sigma subunit)/anti-sigma regulatory factor (Ser/Thr protein kinase)/PAS domain-containing protein
VQWLSTLRRRRIGKPHKGPEGVLQTLSRLLRVVNDAPYAAFGVWEDRCYPNSAGWQLAAGADPSVHDILRDAARSSLESRRLGVVAIAGTVLRALPVTALDSRADAVMIGAFPLEEIPTLYAEIGGNTSSWGELVSALPNPVLTALPDGQIDYWNRQWVEYTGGAAMPSLGGLADRIQPSDRERVLKEWRDGFARATRFSFWAPVERRDGLYRWHAFCAEPVKHPGPMIVKWIVTATDVHEMVEARTSAEESARRLRFLSELGPALHQTFDPVEVARIACRHVTSWIANDAELTFRLFDESVTVGETANSAPASPAEHLSIPLSSRSRELGEIRLSFTREQTIVPEDQLLLAEFADRVAMALDNARMYANERRISTAMQARLLPADLHQPYGMRVDGTYLPCDDDLRIGGDWYDAFELYDGRLAVTVGDVTGHGATAAAMMGTLRQTIRAALLGGATANEALALANDVVYRDEPAMATAFVGLVDTIRMTIESATAGHPAPFVISDDGIRTVDALGPPLGARELLNVENARTTLPDRGALVLYTDGLIEYGRDAVEGLRALRASLERWRDDGMAGDARDLASIVLSGNPRSDDAAMLLVRFAPVEELDLTIESSPSQSEVARRALQRFASGWGLDPERAADLVLASCEAVNNAIEHAYGGTSGVIRIRGRGDGERIHVVVEDAGRWSDAPSHEDRGRGLLIMGALSGELSVAREQTGTSVQMSFDSVAAPAQSQPVTVS